MIRACPLGVRATSLPSSDRTSLRLNEAVFGDIHRRRFLVHCLAPEVRAAEFISGRMIEEQENLFACGNASGEDQRLAVQLVDKRVLKLEDAVDRLRDDFAMRLSAAFASSRPAWLGGIYYPHRRRPARERAKDRRLP